MNTSQTKSSEFRWKVETWKSINWDEDIATAIHRVSSMTTTQIFGT
jgi:hypothetical protein